MPIHWDRTQCKNWGKVPISAIELSMAITGFSNSEIIISEENYREIAKFISDQQILINKATREPVPYSIIEKMIKNAIGFRRSYY